MYPPTPFRIFALLGVLIALPHCGGGKKKEATEPTKPPASEKKVPPPATESATKDEACDQFFRNINRALILHLTRQPKDRAKLLAQGYKNFLEAYSKEKNANQVAAIELLKTVPATIEDCGPYITAAQKFKLTEQDEDQLFPFLRVSLYFTLRAFDRFSGYSGPIQVSSQSQPVMVGAGIWLKHRTDYQIDRKPEYYVLDGFYDGSPNKNQEELLKRYSQLTHIHFKGKDIAVSKLSYEDVDSFLNNPYEDRSDRTPLLATFRNPTDPNDTKNISLSVDEFESSYSHSRWLGADNGIIYIDLTTFLPETAGLKFQKEWFKALDQVQKEKRELPRGMIVDLRGNGGGNIFEARTILGSFLPPHTLIDREIFITTNQKEVNGTLNSKPRGDRVTRTYNGDFPFRVVPLIVLVDRGSASASELVVGALKDLDRAIVLGETTAGKGIGQTGWDLESPLGGFVRVTNFYFFSPQGTSNHMIGVEPDLLVTDKVLDYQQARSKVPMRMAELKKAYPDLIIDAPPRISEIQVEPAKFEQIPKSVRAALKQIPLPESENCKYLPSDEKNFREEQDCLLTAGVFYMEQLISLLSMPVNTAQR